MGVEVPGSPMIFVGLILMIVSLLCGSLEYVLVGVIGAKTKFNVLDTVAYMAPAAAVWMTTFA